MVKKEQIHDSANSSKRKFKGVRMRSWGSWVSEIRAPNQKTRIWLGSYSTPEAAARAYDAALLCLKGSSANANLNFPISSSSSFAHFHISPDTMSPKSIQRVAAEAAAGVANVDTSSPSPPPSSSSSSVVSSPSSINLDDDDGSLITAASMAESWFNFDDLLSPKYVGQMLDGTIFDPVPMIDDCYEESDIRLWSFC